MFRLCSLLERAASSPVLHQQVRYSPPPWFIRSRFGPKFPPKRFPKFPKSGDLETALQVPLDKPIPELADSALLAKAPTIVKRLYSIDFHLGAVYNYRMIDAYKRLNLPLSDKKSLAAQIAQMTVQIRHTIEYLQTPKGRKHVSRVKLVNALIAERKKLLEQLMLQNFDQFKEVCDRLKLRFELAPDLPAKLQPTEAELRVDAELARADELRSEKLHKLRLELAAQRDRFVKQRDRTLEELERELKALEMGVTLEELVLQVVEERREQLLQPVYEDALAPTIEMFEKGVAAKTDAWAALETERARLTEELSKRAPGAGPR